MTHIGDGSEITMGTIEPIEIQEEMEKSFLDYAMSVIVSRALPDARDGLKPVHRRILFGMHDLGVRPDRPHMKCARITGDVMGRFHPHGNQAIYDALARMAQSFSLRHPLIDGHGNFGSPDDPPAAERYTECRLDPLALKMLEGLDEDTVDFVDNYSGEVQEPVVLPARFPNLLVNGSQGIAVGMATNIPPHNLGEVIDATIYLIDHPEASYEELSSFVKGPDFPTGGFILGRSGIVDAYQTGRGSVRIRARAEIEETKRGQRIVVSEIPYQTSISSIATKIEELVRNHDLEGIRDVNDESAKGKTKLVIDLKKDFSANVILNNLYKMTPLQTSFGVNIVALVDGIPRTLNLSQALTAYIDHQIIVITRRSENRLLKAKNRAHIIEGLVKALDLIDQIITLIRSSRDRADAREGLMNNPFDFSEIQANHILDMTLGRLTRLGRTELENELTALLKTITGLEEILNNPTLLRQVIKDDLEEVKKKFATPRKAEIIQYSGELVTEDLIEDEDLVFTMTKSGYVKTMLVGTFKTQARGGRGIQGAKVKEEDLVTQIIHTTSHSYLLFFSNKGRVFRLKAHEVPVRERSARGTAIINLLPLTPGESIQAVIGTREYQEDKFLVFATKQGLVKKTPLSEYDKTRKDGFIAINLKESDELVKVIQTNGSDEIFMVSKKGMVIRFSEAEVRPMGRDASGVRGMKLKEFDEVVSFDVARNEADLTIITSLGYGKRTKLHRFNTQARGGQGVRGIRLSSTKGEVVSAFMVGTEDEVVMISSTGVTIRVPVLQISSQGRDASGVRVMNLDEGQVVASVAPIYNSEEIS